MKPRVKYGLRVGVAGLMLNMCVSAAMGVCGLVMSLLAGATAGLDHCRSRAEDIAAALTQFDDQDEDGAEDDIGIIGLGEGEHSSLQDIQ